MHVATTDPLSSHDVASALPPPLPPPLPPRDSTPANDAPPPYSLMAMSSQDPRSSSTQSLVPDPPLEDSGRRRLLLVYIHGFMGNETSFRSFPAHVHNLVTITLAESHVVHTKIYPRYRSRHSLETARDNFSTWLAPHEDPWTDVILLGHSMGGLLAADIALVFRHRILGIVNFDVPFLGMHPGIIKAGLGSIFNAPPTPQDAILQDASPAQTPSRMSTIFNPQPADPNYNPAFPNDVRLPNRKGWENSLHWLTKHYKDGLKEATKGLVKSHFEFGSAMADYKELKHRYAKVRALEEDDEATRKHGYPQLPTVPRVRFINYYTASTGRPKKPPSPRSSSLKSPIPSPSASRSSQLPDSHVNASADPFELHDLRPQIRERTRSPSVASSDPELTHIYPEPIADSPRESIEVEQDVKGPCKEELAATISAESHRSHDASIDEKEGPDDLPEIPPIPREPPFVDLLHFTDKAQRKAAEKEHDQALKDYHKAIKMRNKIINERTKLQDKWNKDRRKEKKDQEKEDKKRQEERQKEQRKQQERRDKQRKEHAKAEQKREQETEPVSAEEKQRQKEREQRKAEAEQREAEARQRQREADLRQGKMPADETQEPVPATTALEEDVDAMQLGLQEAPQEASTGPHGHYEFSRSEIINQTPPPPPPDSDTSMPVTSKKPKKFCMLPPKDVDGNKDPTWIEVCMHDMDEVTAHTSLFFVNETYQRLVGDVGARIQDWVREADSMRVIADMGHVKS